MVHIGKGSLAAVQLLRWVQSFALALEYHQSCLDESYRDDQHWLKDCHNLQTDRFQAIIDLEVRK